MKQFRAFAIFLGFAAVCSAATARPSQSTKCWASARGETLFVGTRECLEKLPKKRLFGVWVLGIENSVFYPGSSALSQKWLSAETSDPSSEIWLEVAPKDLFKRLYLDGRTRAFRIHFIGAMSNAPGVYGHAGMFGRGALMQKLLKIEELPLH